MDKWIQYLNEARDQRPQPEPTPFKSKAQKQYKSLRRKNDIYSSTAGHKNLKSGAPFDNKAKRAGTDNLRFEEVDPETFEKKPDLHPKFWMAGRLKPRISKRLMKIVQGFIDGLDMPAPIDIEDIVLTGSLANYNWSKYSDVDLHVVVDFTKIDFNRRLVKKLFDEARMRWNELHNITIHGHEVEIYVEDINEVHKSSGIYSIVNDDWVRQPVEGQVDFDYATARKKADAIETEVNMIEKFADGKPRAALKSVERLKAKIRRVRRAGLNSPEQEYSAENIAFKILRREHTLDKLNDMKYDAYDRILSMDE